MLGTIRISSLLVLAVIVGSNAIASEIYHWVDEDGVKHFTQQPPDSDTLNVSKQTLKDTSPPGNGEVEDVYNVEAHEKRMADWRQEREQQREDARENKKQTAKQQNYTNPNQNIAPLGSYWNRPIYGRPPSRPPDNGDRPIFNPRPTPVKRSPGGSN